MNKKSAFTVVAQSQKKVVFEMVNKCINAMLVVSNSSEEEGLTPALFGRNIEKANKLICS